MKDYQRPLAAPILPERMSPLYFTAVAFVCHLDRRILSGHSRQLWEFIASHLGRNHAVQRISLFGQLLRSRTKGWYHIFLRLSKPLHGLSQPWVVFPNQLLSSFSLAGRREKFTSMLSATAVQQLKCSNSKPLQFFAMMVPWSVHF